MSTQRSFKSKSELGEVWDPKKNPDGTPRFVAEESDYLDGLYMDRKTGIGQYNSTVHNIQDDNGKLWAIWGDTVLNKEMEKYKFGTYMRIKFEGRKGKKDNKPGVVLNDKNSFWHWNVMYDENQSGGEVSAADVNDAISAPSLAPTANNNAMAQSAGGDSPLPF